MQHAIKLALVPYESALTSKPDPLSKHLAYRDLHKTADGLAKADASLQMTRLLQDPDNSIPDDVQLKLYNQALRRFLNLSAQVQDEQPIQPTNYWIDKPKVIKRKAEPKSEDAKPLLVKSGKKGKQPVDTSKPARRSDRAHTKWSPWE